MQSAVYPTQNLGGNIVKFFVYKYIFYLVFSIVLEEENTHLFTSASNLDLVNIVRSSWTALTALRKAASCGAAGSSNKPAKRRKEVVSIDVIVKCTRPT